MCTCDAAHSEQLPAPGGVTGFSQPQLTEANLPFGKDYRIMFVSDAIHRVAKLICM